jgi:hypothetical protein
VQDNNNAVFSLPGLLVAGRGLSVRLAGRCWRESVGAHDRIVEDRAVRSIDVRDVDDQFIIC